MAQIDGGRPGFREWLDLLPDPRWSPMPLTHITKGLLAEDICRAGQIEPNTCPVFEETLAYFFYGRPAYRVSGDGALKVEAACPYCFVFDASLINRARAIFAFDTGAFDKRLYKHVFLEEMNLADFSLERDETRPNRLIQTVFETREKYFDGDTSFAPKVQAELPKWRHHVHAYLDLISSRGRNEPDDRVYSIEVLFSATVPLERNLLAVIMPHTILQAHQQAPWLEALKNKGVMLAPYPFIPGRTPEYYQAQLESAVRELYKPWGVL